MISSWPILFSAPATEPQSIRLTPNGRIFYRDGQPWRWMGVTAFGLMNRYSRGENIEPFLQAFQGFNLLRVFYYVEWPGTGWTAPTDEVVHGFLGYVAARGWYVELVALTGPKPLAEAQELVNHMFGTFGEHQNLLIELVNEPGVHDKVDPNQLTVPTTALLWTDGQTTAQHRGLYLTPHTARDPEWVRRAHDLQEYWTGGGPSSPTDPAWKQPATADEPAKEQDVPQETLNIDFRAYFGACAIMGTGATFHAESLKYGNPPNEKEQRLAATALEALNAFSVDAPFGGYRRIDEQGRTLRTYVVGSCMVRMRPTTKDAPEPGWRPLDQDGILWSR